MISNCINDCLYSNFYEDGSVICDKVLLIYGKEIHVESDKVNLPCPSHSDKFIEEIRYMRNNYDLRNAEDSCQVCFRRINLDDINQYGYIETQDKNGKENGGKMQCKICKEKGRR